MTKYVEWSDPWQYGGLSFQHVECISRMKVEDAIKYQHGYINQNYGHSYDSDEDALYDFMTIRWATVKEYDEN